MGTWSLWFFWLAIPNRQGSKCTSKNDSNPNNKFEKKNDGLWESAFSMARLHPDPLSLKPPKPSTLKRPTDPL